MRGEEAREREMREAGRGGGERDGIMERWRV